MLFKSRMGMLRTPTPPTQGGGSVDGDLYWDKVALLLHMDGANNSTNIVDEKGHTMTSVIYGASQSKLSTTTAKFGTAAYLSANLNGGGSTEAGCGISTPDKPELRLTGDFTVEFFAYPFSLTQNSFLFAKGAGNYLQYYNNALYFQASASAPFGGVQTDMALNTWHHIAITKEGSTWRVFVEGVLKSTTTGPVVFGNNASNFIIGNHLDGYSMPFEGRIDEFRITNGVARYKANFIPPSKAFPNTSLSGIDPYWNNVELLLHMDGVQDSLTFVDEKGKTVTNNGTVKHKTDVKKFGSSAGMFNNGLLSVPDITLTGDFTLESWVYKTANSDNGMYAPIISGLQGNYNFPLILDYQGTGTIGFFHQGGGSGFSGAGLVPLNQWTHVTAVRKGTTVYLFVNGVKVLTQTVTVVPVLVNRVGGWSTGGYTLTGYMDEVRITKDVARYTENFIPLEKEFPNQNPALILLHGDGAEGGTLIEDSSIALNVMTGTNIATTTSDKKFGTGSIVLSTASSRAVIQKEELSPKASDFTLECWLKSDTLITGVNQYSQILALDNDNTGSYGGIFLCAYGALGHTVGASGYSVLIPMTGIDDNQWHHLAIVRKGIYVSLYRDGVKLGQNNVGTAEITARTPGWFSIGLGIAQGSYPCKLDEVYYVKKALYDGNFVPPTVPYSV